MCIVANVLFLSLKLQVYLLASGYTTMAFSLVIHAHACDSCSSGHLLYQVCFSLGLMLAVLLRDQEFLFYPI